MPIENCKTHGHWFSSMKWNEQIHPNNGEECKRCGIKYCIVAYDHNMDTGCAVCGYDPADDESFIYAP